VIGTSRGGIIAMLMAAICGPRVAGAVLNDIGPRLEPQGRERIISLISQPASFTSWSEAVASLKASNPGIANLPEDDWNAFARRVFREESGRIVPDYDPRIAHAFPTLEDIRNKRVAELWGFFEGLKEKPCAVLRGENSDLLGEETMQRMAELHPRLIRVTVKDRAHVPFLDEPESIAAIRSVAAACD
jgi:pimeloyl-ACP methyl ester carboxylesterase